MQLARPRHVGPVLGVYLNARSKRELNRAPDPMKVENQDACVVPDRPAQPTVGRAWELDTFTAPVRGRNLGVAEKFGLVVTMVGLIVMVGLMLRPAPLRDETRSFQRLAGTAPLADAESATDFARNFLQALGDEWSPRVFFQNVAPAFWPESAAEANRLTTHYTEGFDVLREHGRLTGIDFTTPLTSAKQGFATAAPGLTLPCTLEFSDGTATRAIVKVVRTAETPRWSVALLSVSPALP